MADEKPPTEEEFLNERIEEILQEFLNIPASVSVGVASYDGELIRSPLEGFGPKKYARILAPFTKRCSTVVKCLEPMSTPLSYTMWTKRMTYTVIIGKENFAFAVQTGLKLPVIPPKPLEELSETERNEKRDKEIRMIKKLREEKAKAKVEAKKKAKEREEKKKKKRIMERFMRIKKRKDDVKKPLEEIGEREERESVMFEDLLRAVVGDKEEEEEDEDEEKDQDQGEDQEQAQDQEKQEA